jgi:hypothetical protein
MNRGYAIYVAMFVALIVGLWGILTAGSKLRAPDSLSGQWQVTWATESPTGGQQPDGTMLVQQSGRFVNVTFDDALRLKLKLAEGAGVIADAGPDAPPARLVGGDWTLNVHRIPQSDELALELTGPGRYQGVARRPTDGEPVDSLSAGAGAAAIDGPTLKPAASPAAADSAPTAPAPTAATHARP